jgi:hypothetical protein
MSFLVTRAHPSASEGSKAQISIIFENMSASNHPERPAMGALCEYCKDFSIASILVEDYRHQPSFDALKESADSVCKLCRLFAASLLEVARYGDLKGESNKRIWIPKYTPKISFFSFFRFISHKNVLKVESRREHLDDSNGEYRSYSPGVALPLGTLQLTADGGKYIVLSMLFNH